MSQRRITQSELISRKKFQVRVKMYFFHTGLLLSLLLPAQFQSNLICLCSSCILFQSVKAHNVKKGPLTPKISILLANRIFHVKKGILKVFYQKAGKRVPLSEEVLKRTKTVSSK